MSNIILNPNEREKNFTRLTQVISYLGKQDRVIEKIYPHRKPFLIRKMKRMMTSAPGHFWYDLIKKNEAILVDRFGGKIHFKIEPVDGDNPDDYYRD